MKYNKILKNNDTNKNTFLIACVCSIVLLLALCYFGVNSSIKGTYSAVTYAEVSECAIVESEYVSDELKCAEGILKSGLTIERCCPTEDFVINTGRCTKTYQSDVSESEAEAECSQFGYRWILDQTVATVDGEGVVYQVCTLMEVPNPIYVCKDGSDRNEHCCPSGTNYDEDFGYCVDSGWKLVDNSNQMVSGSVNSTIACVSENSNSTNDNTDNDSSTDTKTPSTAEVTLSQTTMSIVEGKTGSFTVSANVSGSVTVTSSETAIATVSPTSFELDADGSKKITVTGVKSGGPVTIIVTFTPEDTTKYENDTKTVSVGVTVAEKCWQCNSPNNLYYWGESYSGGSSACASGWHEIDRTKSQCQSFYGSVSLSGTPVVGGKVVATVTTTPKYDECHYVWYYGDSEATKKHVNPDGSENIDYDHYSPRNWQVGKYIFVEATCSLSGYSDITLSAKTSTVVSESASSDLVPVGLMYSDEKVTCYKDTNKSEIEITWNNLCSGLYVTADTNGWRQATTDKYNGCYVESSKLSSTKPSSCTGLGTTVSETTFTATFNANGGTLKGDKAKSCTTTGKSCKISNLPTASKDGYTFTGWGDKSSCTLGTGDELTLSSSETFYACYTKNASSTNTDKDGNTTTNPGTGDIVIALVWFMGLFAVGYSIYYFKQIKQN